MSNQNQCNFTGHLGKDIEIAYSQAGMAVGKVSMAVSEKYKGEEKTNWLNLVFFGQGAEIAGKYLKKGSKIRITAKYQNKEYEKDGQKKYWSEFLVNDFEFLDSKGDGNQGNQNQQQRPAQGYQGSQNQPQPPNDDIPF